MALPVHPYSQTVESFTAVADCPKCGVVGIHWLAEPRHRPSDYGDPTSALWQRSFAGLSFLLGYDYYDRPEAVVARICKECEHRWGQK